ncbi:MAG: hypothetical protein M3459_05310 [Actinomycetota bacterium]|nr:hypothetical protein [Actinomycetota bacterium]
MLDAPTKFLLDEEAIPTHWVNLAPELPGEPHPPLNPQTREPAGPAELTPISSWRRPSAARPSARAPTSSSSSPA